MIINKDTIENVCYECPSWKYEESKGKKSGHCTTLNPRECDKIYDYMMNPTPNLKNIQNNLRRLLEKINGLERITK
jgi:hypothetical protein